MPGSWTLRHCCLLVGNSIIIMLCLPISVRSMHGRKHDIKQYFILSITLVLNIGPRGVNFAYGMCVSCQRWSSVILTYAAGKPNRLEKFCGIAVWLICSHGVWRGLTRSSCSSSTSRSSRYCWAFDFQVPETQPVFLHFAIAAFFAFQLLQNPTGWRKMENTRCERWS